MKKDWQWNSVKCGWFLSKQIEFFMLKHSLCCIGSLKCNEWHFRWAQPIVNVAYVGAKVSLSLSTTLVNVVRFLFSVCCKYCMFLSHVACCKYLCYRCCVFFSFFYILCYKCYSIYCTIVVVAVGQHNTGMHHRIDVPDR